MGPYQTAIGAHCRNGSISFAGMQSAALEISLDREAPTLNQIQARCPLVTKRLKRPVGSPYSTPDYLGNLCSFTQLMILASR